MKVEKAISVGALTLDELREQRALDPILERFDWVHLGSEFCERALPEDEELLRSASFFRGHGKKICFLTPILSEWGARRMEAFLEAVGALADAAGTLDGIEVSVNDYGSLHLIAKKGLKVKVNAGRLLQYDVFKTQQKRLAAQNRFILELFRSHGVDRFEISTRGNLFDTNLADGARFGFDPAAFSLSLYYPYLNLASTRACFMADSADCERECRTCSFEMEHHRVRDKFFISGNTLFLRFPEKFYTSERELLDRRVNRLVYCPVP